MGRRRVAMTLLLDANVLIDFQLSGQLRQLVGAAKTVDMAIAEQVFDEITLEKQRDSTDRIGKKRSARSELDSSQIQVLEIAPGSDAAALMTTLLAPRGTASAKDQGEAASVALAKQDANLVLVSGDKGAILWALNELHGTGERVIRIPIFVRLLFEQAALDAATVRAVAEKVAGHGAQPTWWPSWIAGLP